MIHDRSERRVGPHSRLLLSLVVLPLLACTGTFPSRSHQQGTRARAALHEGTARFVGPHGSFEIELRQGVLTVVESFKTANGSVFRAESETYLGDSDDVSVIVLNGHPVLRWGEHAPRDYDLRPGRLHHVRVRRTSAFAGRRHSQRARGVIEIVTE